MTSTNEAGGGQPSDRKQDWRRFQRWQKFAIDQLGYALNLILTYTIAAVGYCFVLLKDRDFTPGSSAKCTMLLSLLTLGSSAICGVGCVVNRMRDFRATQKRAHPESGSRDTPTKGEVDQIGQTTWLLFHSHVGLFVIGMILLAITLLLTYGGKLR